jgi:hypothetical protein
MADKEARAGSSRGDAGPTMSTSSRPLTGADAAAGPLVVSAANPRYFTIGSDDADDRRVIYLTGSHIWNNFHDGMGPGSDCANTPGQLDYDAYLEFLEDRGHNLIRLWRWEQFKSQAAGGQFHLCMTPQPWTRTGPGEASDGRPKFDLDIFVRAFFDRLRDRVIAAGDRGIYVAVMFFEGWALHLSPAPGHVEGHPFHATNNVNGIGITSILDYQVLRLDPRVQALQEAYIRQVIDTVHDLPNVLWEVANESSGGGSVDPAFAEALGQQGSPEWGDSAEWQYWVIDVVKSYEAEMRYDTHPIGMTMQFPVREPRRLDLARLRRRDFCGRWAPDGARVSSVPLARGPTRRRRQEGRDHRHGPLRPGQGRRAVGMEVLPPRPPPNPHGLRDHRRREAARPVGG